MLKIEKYSPNSQVKCKLAALTPKLGCIHATLTPKSAASSSKVSGTGVCEMKKLTS